MNRTKRLSQKMTRWEYVGGGVYFFLYLYFVPLAIAAIFTLLGWDMKAPATQMWINISYFSVNLLAMILIFHRFLYKNLENIGKNFWGFVQAVILGWVLYQVSSYLVSLALSWLCPTLENLNNDLFEDQAKTNFLVTALGTVFLAPLTEECLFRGLIFQGLHSKNRWVAYILSALAFSLLHVLGYIEQYTWWQMALVTLQYLPGGIALAWAYEKSDTIFAPVVLHMIVNAISMGVIVR